MTVGINTSVLAGQDGKKLTARQVENRLQQELIGNVSLASRRPSVPTRGRCKVAVNCSSRCWSKRCGAKDSS